MQPSERILRDAKILVVDDDATNIRLVERMLDWAGYQHVEAAANGEEALKKSDSFGPDMILLDLHMPGVDGYEVLRTLRTNCSSSTYLPILVFTADATSEAKKKALELGASDFLTKPGDANEIMLRTKNFLAMRFMQQQLNEKNFDLEKKVQERTAELLEAQSEILNRLAMAGEYRDEDTGEHTNRVSDLSARIAENLNLEKTHVELIRLAARLHDLGKIGIADAILMKPGELSAEERLEMQRHTSIGASILANSKAPILQVAEKIALAHHERFDGTGYPAGLVGELIPIEGRIVAVADVFDALTHSRPYKEAWDVGAALREIEAQSGKHFDPKIVRVFTAMLKADLRSAA